MGGCARVRREDGRDDIGVARHADAEFPEPNAEPYVSAALFRAGGGPRRSEGRGRLASCCTGTDAGARGTGVCPRRAENRAAFWWNLDCRGVREERHAR